MFTIYGNRKSFYQWDLNQKLIVNSPICSEVHFSNALSKEALVCISYELDGLTVVDVPNILLTEALDIKAYMVVDNVGSCETCHTKVFEVIKRDKPADYIYTETEVKRYEDYEERIAALEAIKHVGKATEQGGEIFNDYANNKATAKFAHAEGYKTKASAEDSHAEGSSTTASGNSSHAEGVRTKASGYISHAEGYYTTASAEYSHAEGYKTTASGNNSHAEGNGTTTGGKNSHAEGFSTTASANQSHAEGNGTTASGDNSHAEGTGTTASASQSHAEGLSTFAKGEQSHAEGLRCSASGNASHAEGADTIASASRSHAEGLRCHAEGSASHAEGADTKALGVYSHAEGLETIASGEQQHVQGRYNIEDTTNTYAHIVGGGTSTTNRKNIHTLDWNGNAWCSGSVEAAAIILKAPNGTRYKITVNDDGTLITAIA